MSLDHSFGFQTVAEGVETEAHASWITRLGCGYAQGYWHSRPTPEHELVKHLKSSATD